MANRTITIQLNNSQSITILLDDKGVGTITSEEIKTAGDPDSVEEIQFNAAVDGMEALILSIACAGIDISTLAFKVAVVTALDAIGNQY